VTGRSGRLDESDESVAIAVVADLANALDVARGCSLAPDLVPAAAVEVDLAGLQREQQGLFVHVREGEDLARAGVLHHAWDEPPLVKADLRRVSRGLHDHRAIVRIGRSRA
jgi:hypothetical protein